MDMKSCAMMVLSCLFAHAQVQVLTVNGNNDRTNANLQEVHLSPATVNADSFGKLGAYPVDGQVYAQPLYVSSVTLPTSGVRNLLFVATMHNSVYAFDADAASSAPLWQVNLGTSVPSQVLFGPYSDIYPEVGILSTGVVDLTQNVLYVVSANLVDNAPAYLLHALDVATGAERLNGPTTITASVAGTGTEARPNGTIPFGPQQHLQRPGLLLANGVVYLGFGSHADQLPWHGWIITYDASDVSHQVGIFISTPTGNGGSFWQSGHGIAADAQGTLYAVSGNGDYDGVQNFSQSFLRLSGANPTVTGWFTPVDWKSMSDNDFDLSGGPALISGTHIFLGADKGGTLYAMDGDAMLHDPTPGATPASILPASPGPIFNMAVWTQPGGALVYVQGARDSLRCFRITGATFEPNPVSATASIQQFSRMGMTLSADGSSLDTGILWETSGDYNDPESAGTLHAYQASDLVVELWNSDMNSGRDTMGAIAKFASPTVANGRVYVPTFSNRVEVYGLLPSASVTQPSIGSVASAASYEQDAVSPGELVAISGVNLGPANGATLTLDDNGIVTTSIGDTRVLFDGAPVPLIYSSSTQVNAIVPFGIASDSTQVSVEYQGQASAALTLAVTQTTPGIFSADGSGAGQGAILNQDGSLNSPDNPAPAGSVVTLYMTGSGPLSPAMQDGAVVKADTLPQATLAVTATVGGVPATVQYAGGAPGIVAGVLQVNVQIPVDSPQDSAVSLTLQAGGRNTQSGITVAVGPKQ